MTYFSKTHHSHAELIAEVSGLDALSAAIWTAGVDLSVPEIQSQQNLSLLMTRINQQMPTQKQMQQLGHSLAQLHQSPQPNCGFTTDNFIGLNPQRNQISNNWGEFFYLYRLHAQVDMIRDLQTKTTWTEFLHSVKKPLTDWLNANCAHWTLLHGDLWSGNVLFDERRIWLIDPAVYWGDPDVDVAMTELFGGFDQGFYQSYRQQLPASPAYPLKKTIYNLYHLLNHYNLFGSAYMGQCEQARKQITKYFQY